MKVQAAYIFALTRTLRDMGHDPSTLVHARQPLDENGFFRLCEEAAALSQDPSLALRFGSSLHLGSHGVFGHALMGCRTLRQAAEFLMQHNPVRAAHATVRFSFDQDNVMLSIAPTADLPGAANFIVESFFAAAVTAISELVSAEIEGCRVEFAFEPAMPVEIYERYLRLPVSFGKAANRLIGPREIADQPLVAAQNAVAEMYVRQCGKLLREQDRAVSYVSEVRRVLMSARGRIPNEHEVARQLNMSGRTLRRRLLNEGQSFQNILDDVRNRLAKAYLGETRFSIAEVGALLGFEDAANFRRAFRRWNGCSPQSFRGGSMGEAGARREAEFSTSPDGGAPPLVAAT